MSETTSLNNSTVLVVDDERSLRELLQLLLEAEGYRVLTAVDGESALELLAARPEIKLVIQDLRMPGMGGLALLRKLRSAYPRLPVLVVTAFSTWDDAVEAMRLGAYNYIRKPFDTENIRRLVRRALESQSLSVREGETSVYREMIGNHRLMQQVYSIVQRIATTDSTVLIQGESGTGKEMVARAVHYRSHRAARPFVPVNCSAFTDSLLESELFGHRRGAFTGALEDRKGVFQVAEGGTIFLDEVGDMNASTQVKLLRVLEERKISPVGSSSLQPIDVRLVAATNKDMEEEVCEGRFREDLFYRLNVIPLQLPPLRERIDDVPLLVGHFLAKYSKRMGKNVSGISDGALRALSDYSWPGNVRELENIVQRHVALCESDRIETITIRSGPSRDGRDDRSRGSRVSDVCSLIPKQGVELESELEELERRYLREALRMTEGHMTNAAKLLGMSYRSIRYRIKKLGVKDATPS